MKEPKTAPAKAPAPGAPSGEAAADAGAEAQRLEAALAAAKAEAADLKDRWLRARADYENLAKRATREGDLAAKRARAELIRGLLPVVEALGLAEAHLEGADRELREGVALVHRDLHGLLSRSGVAEIPADRKPFDARFHHVVERVETAEAPEGTIVGVVAKGWTIDGEVLRHALVRVATAPPARGHDAAGPKPAAGSPGSAQQAAADPRAAGEAPAPPGERARRKAKGGHA